MNVPSSSISCHGIILPDILIYCCKKDPKKTPLIVSKYLFNRKRIFEEQQFEKPKEDEPPRFNFDLRPRYIQANTEFKLICCVKAHPPPKVRARVEG